MDLPPDLIQALRQGRLVVVWGALSFPLAARPPANRALALSRLVDPPAGFEPAGGLPGLPPVPILSLDASSRVERAFQKAGVPLQVARGRRDAPSGNRHTLLKLGGHLPSRSGVILSRAEIDDLPADADKRHLLAEAGRAAEGGALLLVGCDPAGKGFRAWWAVLAPAFRGAAWFAVGEPSADWPTGADCLGPDLAAISSALRAAVPAADEGSRTPVHVLQAIRDLLLAAFDTQTLPRLFRFTENASLQPLIDEFSPNDGLAVMIDRVIDYCRKGALLPDLLREVKRASPDQYSRFADRLER
jgi:hypothetical protein